MKQITAELVRKKIELFHRVTGQLPEHIRTPVTEAGQGLIEAIHEATKLYASESSAATGEDASAKSRKPGGNGITAISIE
jgi:hypothetical protein